MKNLGCWPEALPIVVEYGRSPTLGHPVPEDEDNIIAALKQSRRISSIRLTITTSLLKKFSIVKGLFPELADLVVMSQDSWRVTLPSALRWGPRLRTLYLTRVTFPALLKLLTSFINLVHLQLHGVLDDSNVSPHVLTRAFSGMAQLQSLSLLLSTGHHAALPQPLRGRVVFPALTHFDFQGTCTYLDDFVARIDAPRLEDIGLTFFKQLLHLRQLRMFVDRISMHKSYSRADIQFSGHAAFISFTQPAPSATCLKLHVHHQSSDVQLFSVAQICHHSAFMSGVEDLRISAASASNVQDSSQRCPVLPLHSFQYQHRESPIARFHLVVSFDLPRSCYLRRQFERRR